MSQMKDRVCIVTGSNSGLGKETALALSSMGATVVMAVRNRERGEKALDEIVHETGNNSTTLMICDLSSMDSISRFTNEFKNEHKRLDVLINNAGTFVFGKGQTTVDGFERTVTVNYLGLFSLMYNLLSLLKSNAPSRIINISSGLSKSAKVDLDFKSEENHNGRKAYNKAKLMVIMWTYELARILQGSQVTANVVLPGFVATNLGKNSGRRFYALMFGMVRPMQMSTKKGAETAVYLASSPEVEGVSGKCFYKKHEATTAPISYDEQLQKQLWDKTIELLGLA